MNGAFLVRSPDSLRDTLCIIADDGAAPKPIGWEHVSVSLASRCPSWNEMCYVKELFWKPEECVVQFHPPEVDYVNIHPFVLHMWRNRSIKFPMPPKELV